MSNIPISNPPSDLTMRDMLAYSSAFGGPAKTCRYVVRVIPQGARVVQRGYSDFVRQLTYLCESAEQPGRAFMNMDGVRYHGPGFKLPYQSQYEDTTMSFLCRTGSYERQFFDDWMEIINPTHTWNFSYRDEYKSEIHIYQLADFGSKQDPNANLPGSYTQSPATAPLAMYQWTLHEAYPIVVNPQPVTWADDNLQRLTVTFTYTKWTRRGWDHTPGNFVGKTGKGFINGPKVQSVTNLPITSKL